MKWFTFRQNNSGGYFIRNENVGDTVLIQAENAEQAIDRSLDIFFHYQEFCPCCGERWDEDLDDDDGTEEPEICGTPIREVPAELFVKTSVLYFSDGTKEIYNHK